MTDYRSASGSAAEDLFIDLFADTFGVEKAGYLYSQYPFYDIYNNARFADFVLQSGKSRIAIEIDDEASHNPRLVSRDKFYDDLLKQNSMIYRGWDVYRWAVRQMQKQPETVKDELRIFLGSDTRFREIEDYLPTQQGRGLKAERLELRKYQQEALDALEAMRQNRETIALLYHATGTGKTVTAVMDAKRCGGRVLFVAHTLELVRQAFDTFRRLWPEVSVGRFGDSIKEPEAHVVCGSIQSVALNLELFRDDDFAYLIIDEAHHASAERYGWRLIDDSNRKQLFLEMVQQMDMSYSYKPVLLKAILLHADGAGRVKISDLVSYFRKFYEERRTAGLVVEKANSIYARGGYTDKEAERNILSNPFKRFQDRNMMRHTRTLGIVEVDGTVWKRLTSWEKEEIERICDEKLHKYHEKLDGKAVKSR